MPPQHRRLPALLGGLVLMAAALVATLLQAPQQLHAQPSFARGCVGYCQHPTNAAKVFRWGHEAWHQEFEVGRLSSHWKSNHRRMVDQQSGMLTLKGGRHTGSIAVWMDNHAARYGRWEARVRAYERAGGGTRYHYVWELVPADRDTRCHAKELVLANYHVGQARVRGHLRTMPDSSFGFSKARDLRNRAWHTYAVEVTRTHISWFVDTRVIRTERRDAALSGTMWRPQLVLKAAPHRSMRPSWLQSDWVRYYDLGRAGAHSVSAPDMHRTTYHHGC